MRKKILIFSLIWFLSLIFGACSQKFSLTKAPLDTNTYQVNLSGDSTSVTITKLGKVNQEWYSWWNAQLFEKRIRYEAWIPELALRFQFPMQEYPKVDQIVKNWQWIESWAIQIPYNSDDEAFLSSQIIVFSAPWLSSWSSLKEIGEVYKHLYEDIYMLKDWRDYEIKRREGYEKQTLYKLNPNQIKAWDHFLLYIWSGENLPQKEWIWYWTASLPPNQYWKAFNFLHKDAITEWWRPLDNLDQVQKNRRTNYWNIFSLAWKKDTPSYFFLKMNGYDWWPVLLK